MKTKYWAGLITTVLAACIGLSLPLFLSSRNASRAEIISNGQVIQIVSLNTDCRISVTTERGGMNIVTVKNGRIGVTEANCPDHCCMDQGMCSGGTQIVCLPNKLVIRFLDTQTTDALAG